MGRMKQLAIELENKEYELGLRELDLDIDVNWWRPLDHDMVQAEMDALELEAEIFELRSFGEA